MNDNNTGTTLNAGHDTLQYRDFDFKDFVHDLFEKAPQPPHSFQLEFLTELTKKELQMLLLYFLMYGSKKIYQKKMGDLSNEQIDGLQEYFKSIGWQAKYSLDPKILMENPDRDPSSYTIRDYRINFVPAEVNRVGNDMPRMF